MSFLFGKEGMNMGNTKASGVYPCYKNQFSVGATKESATGIADAESFSVSLIRKDG